MAGRSGRDLRPGALPTIWSLAIDPADPNILFAGTRPAGVYRSRDGGQQWEKLPVDIARECSIGTAFVTSLASTRRSSYGLGRGGNRRRLPQPGWRGHMDTSHGRYVRPGYSCRDHRGDAPKRLFASTAREVFVSDDLGDTWQPLGIKEKWPLPYARGMAVKADDPRVLFAGWGRPRRVKRATCFAPPIRGDLGGPAPPHPAQCHRLGSCHASRRRRPHRRVQPVRRGVRHRGCRRVLA